VNKGLDEVVCFKKTNAIGKLNGNSNRDGGGKGMHALKLKLKDISRDPEIQIRQSMRDEAVTRYVESFDKLPPIIVFKTKDALLLCDGFHRIAAAERLGKDCINAEVMEGSRQDAIERAIISNNKNGEPLTLEERDEGIRRIKEMHPSWSLRRIGECTGVNHVAVKRVLDIEHVKSVAGAATAVSASHYREIAAAPRECWKTMVETVSKGHLSVDDTANIVRAFKARKAADGTEANGSFEDALSDAIRISIGSDPVADEGEERPVPNFLPSTTSRSLRDLGKLANVGVDAIVGATDFSTRRIWMKQLPSNICFLQDLVERLDHPFSEIPLHAANRQ
jgi:ParB-like chromosome segregation protein Spo0J